MPAESKDPESKTIPVTRLMLPRWSKTLSLYALALAAASFLAAVWPQNIHPTTFYASAGEAFLQAIPANFGALETHMPLKSVFEALLRYHISPEGKTLLLFMLDTATTLSLFCGGMLLGGWAAGALAVFLQHQIISTEPVFSLAVLLGAILFAARAKKYSHTVNIALGLTLGFGLLYRRVLFLLPFAIAALDLIEAEKKERLRVFLLRSLPLICAAYLALTPWIAYNWHVHGAFVPFERNGTALNIVAAALGSTYTLEGNALNLAGIPSGQSETLWAVKYILAHPLAYATAFFLRTAALFKMHPFLFTVAGLGFLLRRKQRDYMAVSITAICFGCTYLLMSMEQRYFEPLWPLLAVLAAAAFADLLPKPLKPDYRRPAVICTLLLFAPLFAFEVWVSAKLLTARPPAQNNQEELIKERLKTAPKKENLPGQKSETGSASGLIYYARRNDIANTSRSLLSSYGEAVQSANYVRYAVTDREMLMNVALILLGQGKYKASLEEELSKLPEPARNQIRHTINKACRKYGIYAPGLCPYGGKEPSTRAELDKFAERLIGTGNDKAALAQACEVLDRNKGANRKVLSDLLPQGANFDKTFADIKVGCELVPATSFHAKGMLAQANGDYREAIRYFDKTIAAYQNNPSFYVDRGVAHALSGDNDSARKDFEQAIRMSPTNMAAYMSLGTLYEQEHNPRKAMDIYRTALSQRCLGDWHCPPELREGIENALRRLR